MDELQYYRCAFDNLSAAVFITDNDGGLLFVNPATNRIFGFKTDEAMELAHVDALLGEKLVDRQTLDEKGEISNIKICIKNKCGREHVLLASVKRIALLGGSCRLYSFHDITDRQDEERELKKLNEELEIHVEEKNNELQRKNIALAEVLDFLEIEKQNLAGRVNVNVQKILLPVIEKLIEKSSSIDGRYLMMIKQNLENLTSSIGVKLSSTTHNLTPKEIELCTLIKGGFSVKEIATMQNLSERTVESHRYNIRKKLGLSSSKINLASYLAQL